MRTCTWLAAVLALWSWAFVTSGKALAHPGTDVVVLDCEDEDDGEDSSRQWCDKDETDDSSTSIMECHDEDDSDEG